MLGPSSSTSVSTASSPGVRADDTARDRLFELDRPERSRVVELPVIFEILKVEKRLEARRSRTSFFFSAASEVATAAGTSGAGGASGVGEEDVAGSSKLGLDGSMTTEGGDTGIGLSTSEYRLTLAGTTEGGAGFEEVLDDWRSDGNW